MDLPIPGSPARSVTDPCTNPPPSTRSMPGSPVGIRGCWAWDWPSGTTFTGDVEAEARAAAISAMVPQAPHPGQRPTHLGTGWRQSVHTNTVAGFAIEHGPADEPWGVRRFFVRDPFGRLVNILSHR